MTTLSEALKNLINSLTDVTVLIGALPTMRFYPVRLPQSQTPVYPAITYQRIDDQLDYSHDGYDGLIDARIQFTIWSQTYLSGETVENALRQTPVDGGINGYKGVMSGVQFDRIFLAPGITGFDTVTQIHQRTMDLMIGYVA